MLNTPSHSPIIPDHPLRVGLVGAGAIARAAHLPAYRVWQIPVVAVASRNSADARSLAADFGITRVHSSVTELLHDDDVDVVDLATGPAGRLELLEVAISAGKHVLAQKPLTVDPEELPRLERLLKEADERGLRIAVNQNGRWAPAWRLTTQLIRQGLIGDVVSVTHLHDKPLPPLAGTPFDDVPHMLINDYLSHWIDISQCWLEGSDVTVVSASDSRTPGQPDTARNPWQADVRFSVSSGASASLRVVGNAQTGSGGCPFWVHGTKGTIRGSVLLDSDYVELDRDRIHTRFPLTGVWFFDGFAGAMGELQTAILEQREPENSARYVTATTRLGLAAAESARSGGTPVHPQGIHLGATSRKGSTQT